MKRGFANVPGLTGCVILAFESFQISPGEFQDNKDWLELFKISYLSRQGTYNIYSWIEERNHG